ncbi:MAG: PAS domain-containing protein [Deltaproteobacteria bacterium]|nr:PAS domain-containing protein [Deltaproteobacteria bacterium]
MKNKKQRSDRKFWAGVSPWFIIGAVVIFVPIFTMITLENVNKQKEYTTQLLIEKGEALIRSFEAGARTGIGMKWSSFQLQKLLIETAEQPGIDHISVIDTNGTVIADSDPSMIGETYAADLDLVRISGLKTPEWRQVHNPDGDDTFEVYRQFAPTEIFSQGLLLKPVPETPGRESKGAVARTTGLIIFVGMDMGPINALRKQDTQHTIMMSVIFVLIGISGIISLFLAQSYRAAKTTLSRVKAFSDSLVENMPIGLIAINNRDEIISFNQTAESVLGHSFHDILGKKADDILPRSCSTLLQTLKVEKKVIEREIECPVQDGRIVHLEVIATALEEDTGDFLGYVILFRDITEILHMKKEMERSQRMASLGSLAAGLAHEIRNPLSSIKGFATFFRERSRNNPEEGETAAIMIQEVDRLNRVISQLLEFAKPMEMNRQWASPQEVIRHTVKMVEEDCRKKNIAVHTDISPKPENIYIDPDKITQVLLNLYLNAMGAMEQGGTLSVAFYQYNDRMIRIDVSDTGTGIDKEHLNRIFDPYFTTRLTGTGLGLAIVHRIVEAHEGEIRVESKQGRGTTVSVFLPVCPSSGIPNNINSTQGATQQP